MKPLLKLALIFCVCLAPQTSAFAQTFSSGNTIDVQGGERCATIDAGPANLARAPEDMAPWLEPYQESGANTSSAGAKANTRVIPVAFHITHLYAKLDVRSRGEAVRWAWRHGLGS